MRPILGCFWAGAACVGTLISLGCGSDTTGPAPKPVDQLYWKLTLNHHAITLATISPYDTIQFTVTPQTVTGATIPTTARPVYTTSDTSITIDSTGFVRVHTTKTVPNITVIARLTVGGASGATLADTAFVNVVEQASATAVPKMDSLLLQPTVGDSAIRGVLSPSGGAATQTFATPLVKDSAGKSIPNVVVRFYSANPLVAKFAVPTTGTVTAVSTGFVLLTAEATVYGRSLIDSLLYKVEWPTLQLVAYGSSFAGFSPPAVPNNVLSANSIVVGQGGTVCWVNTIWGNSDDSLDVVFDDTSGIQGLQVATVVAGGNFFTKKTFQSSEGGNIPSFETIQPVMGTQIYLTDTMNVRVRVFNDVGTYTWHSQHQGISGQIQVKSNAAIQ